MNLRDRLLKAELEYRAAMRLITERGIDPADARRRVRRTANAPCAGCGDNGERREAGDQRSEAGNG